MSLAAFDKFRKGPSGSQGTEGQSFEESAQGTPTKQAGLSAAPQPAKIQQDVLGNKCCIVLTIHHV